MVAVSVFPGELTMRENRSDKSRKSVSVDPGLIDAYLLSLGVDTRRGVAYDTYRSGMAR